MIKDIDKSVNWISCEKLNKGWSSDEKYIITTKSGDKQLLRIADIASYKDRLKRY